MLKGGLREPIPGVIFLLTLFVIAGIAVGYFYSDPVLAGLAAVFVSGCILGGMLVLVRIRSLERKLDKYNANLKRHTENTYAKVEAYHNICKILDLRLPLPSMTKWAASPEVIWQLVSTILEDGKSSIIDLGSGVSTLACAYALKKNGGGKVYSVDHDSAFLEETQKAVAQHGLEDWVELIYAPLISQEVPGDEEEYLWYDMSEFLRENPGVDLLFVDGPPGPIQRHARYPAVPKLYDKLSHSATIVVDDYSRTDEKEIVQRWLATYSALEMGKSLTGKRSAVLRHHVAR